MMNDNLDKLITDAFEQECEKLSEIDIPHYETSEKFRQSMKKLPKKKPPIIAMTRGALAACASFVFALGLAAGVKTNASIPDFIEKIVNGRKTITATDDGNAPDVMTEFYLPTAIPEGFIAEDFPNTMTNFSRLYRKGSDSITFDQYVISVYKDVESECNEYYLDSNGTTYRIYLINGMYCFVWSNGDYVFHVVSSLSREETLDICRSVKKVRTYRKE